jgi:ABC-type Mn2+/Zn2+ transport system ATPase subunit
MLHGTDLVVRYPGAPRRALDGVSCGLEAGRLLAIVGPNGSGKSTLVRALLGLVPLESGSVSLHGRRSRNGRDMRSLPRSARSASGR